MVTEIFERLSISFTYNISTGVSIKNPDHLPWISVTCSSCDWTVIGNKVADFILIAAQFLFVWGAAVFWHDRICIVYRALNRLTDRSIYQILTCWILFSHAETEIHITGSAQHIGAAWTIIIGSQPKCGYCGTGTRSLIIPVEFIGMLSQQNIKNPVTIDSKSFLSSIRNVIFAVFILGDNSIYSQFLCCPGVILKPQDCRCDLKFCWSPFSRRDLRQHTCYIVVDRPIISLQYRNSAPQFFGRLGKRLPFEVSLYELSKQFIRRRRTGVTGKNHFLSSFNSHNYVQ